MTAAAVDVPACSTHQDSPLLFGCGACRAAQDALVDVVSTGLRADPEFKLFVDACRTDAFSHGGFVSQNRVRAALSNEHGLTVNPRRYSTFWRRAQLAGYLSAPISEEDNRDRRGHNLGKKSKIHRWR